MKTKRILLGVVIGLAAVAASLVVLARTLGNDEPAVFQGRPVADWAVQVNASAAAASNQANAILTATIIPRLTESMFHDTHDSALRMRLVEAMNELPGIMIFYSDASQRRAQAAQDLGGFGPAAQAAIPALVQALQNRDEAVHAPAIKALGAIHGEPERVIPFLTRYLADESLNDEAATALGKFGALARPAVPKIIPLLSAHDKDARVAAAAALMQIDPEAYNRATNSAAK